MGTAAIAERLGISEQAVKIGEMRALHKLYDAIRSLARRGDSFWQGYIESLSPTMAWSRPEGGSDVA